MAIEKIQWDLMTKYFPRPARVLCLGYPDMLVPAEALPDEARDAPEVENADEIRKWHGWTGPIFDTKYVFRKMGWDATTVDFKPGRGVDMVLDLNNDTPHTSEGFDAVLDPGTLEHLWNVGIAWMRINEVTKPDGILIHVSPVNCVNHGFWSISPGAYADFYGDNLIEHYLFHGPKENRGLVDLKGSGNTYHRMQIPVECWNLVVAKRTLRTLQSFPVQKKYQ